MISVFTVGHVRFSRLTIFRQLCRSTVCGKPVTVSALTRTTQFPLSLAAVAANIVPVLIGVETGVAWKERPHFVWVATVLVAAAAKDEAPNYPRDSAGGDERRRGTG